MTLFDPSGEVVGVTRGELDTPETITAAAMEGIWAVRVREVVGLALRDVGLSIKPATMVCTARDNLIVSPIKEPGLIAHWPLDEGRGAQIADGSQRVAYNGTLRDGKWIKGVRGTALAFDGRHGGVSIRRAKGCTI